MAVLVVAEHDNASLKPSTLNTVTAATKIGGDVAVLVAGAGCAAAAEAAAKIAGVAKVLVADAPYLEHPLAENLAPLVVALAKGYSHVLAPATTFGKNLLPRVAALLDVQQISEITAVVSADTFERPIYAGNAIATVQSKDPIKVITVRTTGFDAAAATGGSAAIEKVDCRCRCRPLELRRPGAQQVRPARAHHRQDHRLRRARHAERREFQAARSGRRQARRRDRRRRAPRSMPASCPTTTRSARPARWWRRISISPSASPVPSSIWPA